MTLAFQGEFKTGKTCSAETEQLRSQMIILQAKVDDLVKTIRNDDQNKRIEALEQRVYRQHLLLKEQELQLTSLRRTQGKEKTADKTGMVQHRIKDVVKGDYYFIYKTVHFLC